MSNNSSAVQAYRASILHFTKAPTATGEGVVFFDDGLLVVRDGKIYALDHAEILLAELKQQGIEFELIDKTGQWIMPGFIDSHIHFPQINIIGSYGEKLLDWLNNYTFPAEMKFSDKAYAEQIADVFVQELLASGTTTAMVYCTVHEHSVDAFFQASQKYGTCMLAGKVLMDRHCPEALRDTPITGYEQSQALIDRWHGNGRQLYTVTPRFAPTSTPEQLTFTGKLLQENTSVYMQTHLSENIGEIAWVKELYPQYKNYLDVYDGFGLLGSRSVFGHCIHLSDDELTRMSETNSKIAFCPTSNLFLGSGLFELQKAKDFAVKTSIATDVGAGTSFCQLQTLAEAYKVNQLNDYALHPYEAFYWLTLGNAECLELEQNIGNFETNKIADFIVLDFESTPLMKHRMSLCNELHEKLFLLMTIGDDRNISETYVAGKCVYS